MFSCNLRSRLIFLHGCSRTHCVASLRAVPVGRISYNLNFDCKHVRSVTCDLINDYTAGPYRDCSAIVDFWLIFFFFFSIVFLCVHFIMHTVCPCLCFECLNRSFGGFKECGL